MPYNAEFYYDTPNPIRILKANNYSFNLQWTQRDPEATDRIIGYWINVRQNKQNLLSKQVDLKGVEPVKGVLLSYAIADLRIPLSYEVRLAPVTTYSTGDYVSRTIQYSEPYTYPRSSDHVCGFEDERICGFSQDRTDMFDWTRQNHLTQNPKRSANTGPEKDRSGTKDGYYMYIEASRPGPPGTRLAAVSTVQRDVGERPQRLREGPYWRRLLLPHEGQTHRNPQRPAESEEHCRSLDSVAWSKSGHQGPDWKKAFLDISPSAPFQVGPVTPP
ncbi:hypothetical protein CRUP_007314 [Coryphaenoides rupestris]|nr:hypothetical protein CRUP_007314 [Coryphaenoides rupestris]